MPRARRSGGNISAAAARESSTIACAGAAEAEPEEHELARHRPAAERDDDRARPSRSAKPARITGIRPTRSESRPAGPTASAPAIRNTAGPSPRIPSNPVTATSVTVPSATASCTIPDRQTSPAASTIALRRIVTLTRELAAGPRRMPRRRRATGGARTGRRVRPCATRPTGTTRRPRASSRRRRARGDLGARRAAVRRRSSRDASARRSRAAPRPRARAPRAPVHDRGRGLGRPFAGELALGGERDPGDPRAAAAGRLGRRAGSAPPRARRDSAASRSRSNGARGPAR